MINCGVDTRFTVQKKKTSKYGTRNLFLKINRSLKNHQLKNVISNTSINNVSPK